MKWYSIKKYMPPMDTTCLIFTENNYYYVGRLIDGSDASIWHVDSECDEHGSFAEAIHGVTHFLIPGAVKLEEEEQSK